MRRLSLRAKVFLLFSGAALLTVVPALLLIADAVERAVYQRATSDLADAADRLRSGWASNDAALLNAATARAFNPRTAESWRSRTALQKQLRDGLDASYVVAAVDTTGRQLLGPVLPPEEVARLQDDAARAREGVVGNAASRVVLTADRRVPLRLVARTVERTVLRDSAIESEALGTVVVGVPLTARTLRDEGKPGAEVAISVNDSLIGTTLPDSLRRELLALDPRAVRGERGEPRSIEMNEQPYLAVGFDVPARGMRTSVVLLRPVANELRVAQGIKSALIGIGAASLVVALLLAALVSRIVARPAQALAEASVRLARGDYQAPLPRAADDEIGQLARAFGDMREAIAAREERLRSAQAEMIHREKLAAMGRLVAQLSHEINNPIYNIQNCLEALDRRGDPRDPNREFLALAQEELLRMAALTRQLLDQSRPQSDAAAPTDLNALATRVLSLAERKLAERGVTTELVLDPVLPEVTVHPESIQQVLANLVDNAADAMPGGGRLRVTTRGMPDAVELVVEDTGTGITETDLPHIFDAFYTTKPTVAGVGLGLFVSEGIVRGHRGQLTVTSDVGSGSRFTVRLPRETLDESVAQDAAEAAAA